MERRSVERRLKCAHFVQKHAKGPNITLEVVGFRLDNLRRQIVRSTHNGLGLRGRFGKNTSDAEITELKDTAFRQEQVLGFKITMENLFVMNVF